MKTIPPSCPEPESGQKYWRSLDQLADAPEFRQWVEREFPAGASELTDPVTRRSFVKLMSASFALGGLGILGAGCRRPEEKILPFGKAVEGYIHGVPQYFATAMPTRGGAVPLVVKSSDGRPTKIEGNPDHPDSNGATDAWTQAALLSLYDPDRAQRVVQKGNKVERTIALDALGNFGSGWTAPTVRGAKVAFVLEQSSSPSRQRVIAALQAKLPQAKWAVYEPLDLHAGRRLTAGTSPYYKLESARAILSLDCDFMGTEAEAYRSIRNFSKGRRLTKATDAMNRLYAVEGLMTLTGMNADHRLRVGTSQVAAVAAAIAAKVAPQNAEIAQLAAKLPLPANVKPEWIAECANDLLANKGTSLVLAGHRQPAAVHAIANLLNAALENTGKTVLFASVPETQGNASLAEIATGLRGGQIDTLVILGGNPAYNAPADVKWAEAQAKATNVIRLGAYEDETFAASPQAMLHLPQAHFLESWGDAVTSDGTVVAVQPLIAPLFDGFTELEVLARLGGLDATKPHDIVRETFRASPAGAGNFEENWKKFLHDGFASVGKPAATGNAPTAAAITSAFAAAASVALSKDNLEVVFHRDLRMDDGRWNNNGWLQEFPDPVTKVTWDALILISRKTAAELGVSSGTTSKTTADIVKVTVQVGGETKSITGPIWVQPGMADNSLGLALGYGRKKTPQGGTGRVGNGVGLYNAYDIRASGAMSFATGAKLEKTGERYELAITQEHGSMEGRPIIREANKAQYEKFPKFATNFDLEAHSEFIPLDPKTGRPKGIYEHPYEAYENRKSMNGVNLEGKHVKSEIHQWGMAVDLNQCVGCGACVLACQAENNVPIVGKDQVKRNREMHWLRIDRYFSGAGDKFDALVDDPQAVNQPMMCQHCENAPCESVCPVNATVHDDEGVNVMAYNRCVGTRYCSNNCAYKVRRFNFLDYNKRSLEQLKGPYYSSPMVGSTDGEWTLKRWWTKPDEGIRPQDEWDILKLIKNPDVTVRMRGVMEKCTFCVQRIEQGKIAQKVKAGQSGDVRVPDGGIKPACQQVCPAEAITFGNQLDPASKVSQLQKSDRNYEVLGFLETRPRVTYLARIRNPNPKMPDYQEFTLNLKPYVDKNGNPYEAHAAGEAHGGAHGAEKKGAH